MKTKYFIAIIAILLIVFGGLSVYFLLPQKPGVQAEVFSRDKVIATVDLNKDQSFTITAPNGGTNTVTVKDGKIAVTHASCDDQICALMGWCDSGLPIVCLPNSLIISFPGDALDGYVG